MAHLSLTFFGVFQACLEGNVVASFDTLKTRALLVYLADEPGKVHSRLALADLLWPERAEDQAFNNLRNNLANLRRAIQDDKAHPAFLRIERDSITFNPLGDSSIDTVEFMRLVENSGGNSPNSIPDLALLEKGISFYQGDFLASFPPVKSPPLEEWILYRRAKYRALQIEGLHHLAKASLSRSEYRRVISLARRQLAIEPWYEEAYQQLIAALALDDRRSEALSEFNACRELMDRELGIAPSPVTLQLVESIRTGKLTRQPAYQAFWPSPEPTQSTLALVSTGSFPNNLPHSLTRLIGREKEVTQVKQLLLLHRLVMLTGAGGVGKTRLALAAAAEAADQFQDGVWLADLSSLNQAAELPGAVLHALGIEDSPVQVGPVRLSSYLYDRRMLLLLDNCEHLIVPTAELARLLLQTCPYVKILATSREKFGIESEVACRVPGLAFPEEGKLPPAETNQQFEAVHMLVERAQVALPGFQVNEANWPAVAYICQRLDGIPLALELAATHLALLSPTQLAARLDGSFHFLTRANRAGVPRHLTLRATIDWSYEMLSSAERLLLARLSVFTSGWTLEAAEAACAGEEIASLDVLDLLMRLVNQSIVSVRRQPQGETRYYLLETVRQYAQEKLQQGREAEVERQRHCSWVLDLARQANLGLHRKEHPVWLKNLDAEHANIFSALAWAIEKANDIPCGLRILSLLDLWWQRGRDEHRVMNLIGQAVSRWTGPQAEADPTYVEALSVLAYGQTARDRGIAMIERAVRLAKELEPEVDRSTLATAYYLAGVIVMRWDSDAQAELDYMNLAEEAFSAIWDHHPYPLWISWKILEQKSSACYHMGDLNRAALYATESWVITRKIDYNWDMGPLTLLGKIAQKQGDFIRAREYFVTAVAQPPEVEGGWWLSSLISLADLERQQGRFVEALRLLQDAIRHSRERFGFFLAIELLEELAYTQIIASRGRPEQERRLIWAACCLGAAQASREIVELNVFNFPAASHPEFIAELHQRLDPTQLRAAWAQGNSLNIDQAVQNSLKE